MSDSPVTPADLAEAALAYRHALDAAAQVVAAVDAELLEVRTRHHPVLAAAAADCQTHRDTLVAMVRARPGLFQGKSKSAVAHGIHYGIEQQGGKWHWPKAPALLALVKAKLAPSAQERVIKAPESVQVSLLTDQDRARLGIARDPVADAPFAREHKADSIARLMDLLGRTPAPDYIPLPPGQGKTAAIEETAA